MTQISFEQNGAVLAAYLCGEIDHHWAAVLREKIDARIHAAQPEILILDFAAVTFMDSSGVGLILGRFKLLQVTGGTLVVQKAPQNVRRMLALAGISCRD